MCDGHGVFKLSALAISLSVDRHESLELEEAKTSSSRHFDRFGIGSSKICACTSGLFAASLGR
jgi:hypothetical protein